MKWMLTQHYWWRCKDFVENVKIEPEMRLLDVFSSLVGWNVLMLHRPITMSVSRFTKVIFNNFSIFQRFKKRFFLLSFALSEVEHVVHDVTVSNVALICHHFSGKTALRIFPIFCMNVPYYKVTQRTRRFFREKSSSLIIHENRFLPFWVILINFPWFVLADIAYSARSNRSWSTGNVTRSWRIIQKSQKCIFGWSKEQKRGFSSYSGVLLS